MGKKKKTKKRTAKRATSPGGGSKNEQIERLKKSVGKSGVKAAQAIKDNHEPDVVRLAFKLLDPVRNVKLSKYDKSMMDALGLSEDQWLKAKAARKSEE